MFLLFFHSLLEFWPWVNILQNSQVGGGCYNKLFWAKFSKIRILRPRSAQKNCSFTMFFGQNPPKTRYFSSKWAFFLICFIIWHLFLIIWQMFPKIIIFALQQIKIFQNHPLSKIRIFWKNIHPCIGVDIDKAYLVNIAPEYWSLNFLFAFYRPLLNW